MTQPITPRQLRGARSPEQAIALLLRPLGYDAAPLRMEDGYLDLPSVSDTQIQPALAR